MPLRCATISGGDRFGIQAEHVILPAVEGQNLIVDPIGNLINVAALICLQDCRFALGGDLIDVQSAVGAGVVAHLGCPLVDLSIVEQVRVGAQDLVPVPQSA